MVDRTEILKLMSDGKIRNIAEIAEELFTKDTETIRTQLSDLTKDKKLIRVGWGKYVGAL